METHPTTSLVYLLAASLLVAPVVGAEDKASVVGSWDLVAQTPNGPMSSVLKVTETAGELEAEIQVEGLTRRVTDERMGGDVFHMTVHVDGMPYAVEMTFDGDTAEGTWSGTDASGTLKGNRKP